MIAALIFVISSLTLLQFFVSYSRSLIAESRVHLLSEETREICGMTARKLGGDQFRRLLQLIALCPEPGGEGFQVRAVTIYFRLLSLVEILSRWTRPSVSSWIEEERGGCAYVAAVALDRRIAYSRTMMAQQASH
jgi:hypothetical protein